MKTAIYCRVSTEEQNIDTQLDFLRLLCEREKHDIYKEYLEYEITTSLVDEFE